MPARLIYDLWRWSAVASSVIISYVFCLFWSRLQLSPVISWSAPTRYFPSLHPDPILFISVSVIRVSSYFISEAAIKRCLSFVWHALVLSSVPFMFRQGKGANVTTTYIFLSGCGEKRRRREGLVVWAGEGPLWLVVGMRVGVDM